MDAHSLDAEKDYTPLATHACSGEGTVLSYDTYFDITYSRPTARRSEQSR